MHIYTNISDIQEESIEKGLNYIYVLENYPQHNVKVGITSNAKQRLISLSGSNNGGNKPFKIAVSQPTYLYVIEKNVLNHFHYARIKGTEWFDGTKITFEELVEYIDNIFNSPNYTILNEERSKVKNKVSKDE